MVKITRNHHSDNSTFCFHHKKVVEFIHMTLTYAVSLSSTSGGRGTAGGGIFIARTDSSSESSATFLEKRILILEELRDASGINIGKLNSAPFRRSTLSVSDGLLTNGD